MASERDPHAPPDSGYHPDEREDPNDVLWGGSLSTVLVVVGIVLVLFPEPATSGIGVALLGLGLVGYLLALIG